MGHRLICNFFTLDIIKGYWNQCSKVSLDPSNGLSFIYTQVCKKAQRLRSYFLKDASSTDAKKYDVFYSPSP